MVNLYTYTHTVRDTTDKLHTTETADKIRALLPRDSCTHVMMPWRFVEDRKCIPALSRVLCDFVQVVTSTTPSRRLGTAIRTDIATGATQYTQTRDKELRTETLSVPQPEGRHRPDASADGGNATSLRRVRGRLRSAPSAGSGTQSVSSGSYSTTGSCSRHAYDRHDNLTSKL